MALHAHRRTSERSLPRKSGRHDAARRLHPGRRYFEEAAMERMEYETGAGNGGMKDVAAEKIDEVREYASDAMTRLESFVRERPGTAILAALGAGYLIGRIIRR